MCEEDFFIAEDLGMDVPPALWWAASENDRD